VDDVTRKRRESMVKVGTVTAEQISEQRAKGWPDFHPEDFCHRCGHPNMCWFIASEIWNPVMRPAGRDTTTWLWNEIICPQCFAELAGRRFGNGIWQLVPYSPDLEAQ
jgi:hypothetical protein